MSCGFKTKNTCGEKVFATCVYYERVLPAITTLEEADCYTLEEIVTDIYLILVDVTGEIEVDTLLQDSCLTYTEENGKIPARQAIKTLDAEVCDLKDKFDNIAKYSLCDLPIAGCGFDLGDLADQCDNPPTTFGELIQILIDSVQSESPS